MRIIAVFEKNERLRHIGHLDIQRAVQRALRRSGLPVAYSKGFNPHILVTFASALSTGASGRREIMDVTMEKETDTAAFLREMNRAMPQEMRILEARAVEDRHPAMMAMLKAASYELTVLDQDAEKAICSAVPQLMKRNSIMAVRKTKTGLKECDIRPLIYHLEVEKNHLICTLALTEREACKPNMLIDALKNEAGLETEFRVRTVRTALLGEDENGVLVPLENL